MKMLDQLKMQQKAQRQARERASLLEARKRGIKGVALAKMREKVAEAQKPPKAAKEEPRAPKDEIPEAG